MTFFCGVCGCRNFWHQIEGTSKFLPFQLLHMKWDVSAYQSTGQRLSFSSEFHFTAPFFNLYLFISAYKENKEIMNSYIEIYIVLNFTVVCHIILLLLAVLQCCLWKGSCLFRVLKDVKLQYYQSCRVGLQLWSLYQKCLYQRCVTLDTAHGLMR
jgi:hypothetical protein